MKYRISLLLTFLAAFLITTPALADTTGGDSTAAKAEDSTAAVAAASDTGAATEPKLEDPKASGGEETKAEDTKVEPAEIKTDEEAMSVVAALIDAAKKGHWSLVAALAIMLVVYGLKRSGVLKKLGSKALPWVAVGTGTLGYVAAYLMVPGSSVATALVGALMASAMASGLWEMLFKHFLGDKPAA